MNWKPISEAPTDKTILGCWYDHEFVCMEMVYLDGEWRANYGNYWCPPTHFVILEPPEEYL